VNYVVEFFNITYNIYSQLRESRNFVADCKYGRNVGDRKALESLTGLRQAKGLIQGPSTRRKKDLLRLNRDQLRWVVGLLTGHCHLKGHLFKSGLINDRICEKCQDQDESATHIL
jgi:hypothetical protein